MISIHQSQFLPWVPYFYKIIKSDVFVVLDHVQYQKNGVQNRNMIKTSQGGQWITLPVSVKLGMAINEVEIAGQNVYEKLIKTLDMNYHKSPCFNEVFSRFEPLFKKNVKNLHEINKLLIKEVFALLNIQVPLVESSTMELQCAKDDLVIEIIKKQGDTEYLSGKGALDYMDLEKFKKAGIKVFVYKFNYAPYAQLWDKQGFIADLSIVDLLFNSADANNYINANGSLERVV